MTLEEFRKKYEEKHYLGDGAYVHFDGFQFIVSTDRENGEHWVGLEPEMMDYLMNFKNSVYQDAKNLERED